MNRRPTTNRRRVKTKSILERIFAQFADGKRQMLPGSRQIRESSRNKLCALFRGVLQHRFSVHLISCSKKVSDAGDLRPEALIWCEAFCRSDGLQSAKSVMNRATKNRHYSQQQTSVKAFSENYCPLRLSQ